MTVTAVYKDANTLTMTITAEFDASPERVWQLWADPRQLERCMLSGVVMGISEALKEEVTFDTGKITSTIWSSRNGRPVGWSPPIVDCSEPETVYTPGANDTE